MKYQEKHKSPSKEDIEEASQIVHDAVQEAKHDKITPLVYDIKQVETPVDPWQTVKRKSKLELEIEKAKEERAL